MITQSGRTSTRTKKPAKNEKSPEKGNNAK